MPHSTAPDLFDLRFLRSARLSPDGQHYAYSVSYTDNREHIEIWIGDIHGGYQKRLSYEGDAQFPCWSPDGRWLAIVADGRLRIVEVSSLIISEALTPEHLVVQGPPAWAPDSAGLALSLRSHRIAEGPRRIAVKHFRADGIGYFDGIEQCIYQFDRSDRKLSLLAAPHRFCSQPQWSSCSGKVLFLASDNPIPFASMPQRLLTVDLEDRRITEVLGKDWYVEHARWIAGGERIAVAGAYGSTLTIPVTELWTVDAQGGGAQLRTRGLEGNVGFRINHDMPARELLGTNPFCVLDRDTAYVSLQRGGAVEIWRVALAGELSMQKISGGERACIVLDANHASDVLLFGVTSLHSPTELARSSLNGSGETKLTRLNDEVLAGWPRPKVERFEFSSADGLGIESWFMAPADRSGPAPCVLFIHAGPFIATGHAFRYDFHLLASRGYGIVFANFRGSAGYGESFARAIMGNWGAHGYPDHMGAIDAAIVRGYADPSRIGVWGPSHGGFATCWIVGHTSRFKAAVAEASSCDLAALYYTTDAPEVRARDLGGRPHEIPDIYRACSPITYAHRCSTPTLLLHGEDDYRCPIGGAEQFHRALQDAGCIAELVRIPNCSHLGDSSGPLSARRAQNEALLNWFERYL